MNIRILSRLLPALALPLLLTSCGELPPPGKRYDVGGFKLHIMCSGPEDPARPTVIIEGGGGIPAVGYYWLQAGLEKSIRVCSYDRAGMGWSDESGQPHDGVHIARQLHALLAAANVRPPYVFAGHSIGGLFQTVYAGMYPDEVAGLAYLDSSHRRQFELQPAAAEMIGQAARIQRLVGWYARLGLMNVYNLLDPGEMRERGMLPDATVDQIADRARRARQLWASAAELDGFAASGQQAAPVTLGDRPVVVLSAGSLDAAVPPEQAELYAEARRIANELQPQLASLSTRGERVIIPEAGHVGLVMKKQFADQVVAHILRVAGEATVKPD